MFTAAEDIASHEVRFSQALEELWARDAIAVDAPGLLARRVATSFLQGGIGVRRAARLLDQSGARRQWNDVLRQRRAACLAGRILPHISGSLLDLLAGDGSICRALANLGVASIAATERRGHYPAASLTSNVTIRPFDDALDLSWFGAGTVLLSTVLHHEPDPVGLLDRVSRAGIPRWIVIENCVTTEFSRHFHQLADQFFNTCLNDFGVACVEEHRTLGEWTDLLSTYGDVDVVDAYFTVPGIPFPYSLMVVHSRTER